MTQSGLQYLPLELLQEIVNYIPDLPFPFTPQPSPYDYPLLEKPLPADEPRVQRTLTLRSLSQTCRLLRELARPVAWEVIEVVSVKKEDAEERQRLPELATKTRKSQLGYRHQLGGELRRQLRVVLEDESLRTNLRRVSVIVTESSARAALEMFEAFPTFPKLHTIQLFSLSNEDSGFWHKNLISSLRSLDTPLKSVKNVVLPHYGKDLLRHCPALEVVVATLGPLRRDAGRDMLKEILNHCPSVKLLRGLPMDWPTDAEPLVKGCPQLSYLCFDDTLFCGCNECEGELYHLQKRIFQQLSSLKQIRHITLIVEVLESLKVCPRDQFSIMHCIMLLGEVSGANLEEYLDNEDGANPFTSPIPTALLPLWFLKKIIPREVSPPSQRNYLNTLVKPLGLARTLTVDIDGTNRPVAIFSVLPPTEGNSWPRLLGMRVGYRSDDAFEELYDLIDIPLNIDWQPDPLSNVNLSRPPPLYHKD